jgi:O-antigen/teichoic acid export membrane protein
LAQSAARKLFAQTSHYSIASLFTLISGVITFPLLTRLFSVRDYGIINLIAPTLSLSVALGKTGLQHAIVRYYAEISSGKGRYSLSQLYSTTLLGMGATAVVAALALAAGAQLAPLRWLEDERVRGLLAIVSLLVIVQVIDSTFTNLLQGAQRSTTLMKYQIAKKYLSLACMLAGLLLISRTLWAFYSATVIAEATAIFLFARILMREDDHARPRPGLFSRPLYVELLRYGLPMTFGYELAGVILSVGDRYVIKSVIGEEQVGLYSAAYNLCQYVQSVFLTSIGTAILPICMKMYDEEGAPKTSAFVSQSLGNYFLMAAPVVAGVASVGPELLPSLASERYASAGGVLPWVIAGMVVDTAATIAGAGLYIHRKATIMMFAVAGSALINVLSNLLLVPRFGIVGAAAATLVGYTVLYCAFALCARRFLHVPFPWAAFLRAALAAVVMYGALRFILPGRRFLTVAVRGVAGVLIYGALIAAIDANARSFIRRGLARLRARSS